MMCVHKRGHCSQSPAAMHNACAAGYMAARMAASPSPAAVCNAQSTAVLALARAALIAAILLLVSSCRVANIGAAQRFNSLPAAPVDMTSEAAAATLLCNAVCASASAEMRKDRSPHTEFAVVSRAALLAVLCLLAAAAAAAAETAAMLSAAAVIESASVCVPAGSGL